MDDETPPGRPSQGITPDVRTLMESASAQSADKRAKRRAEANARAEEAWRKKHRRQQAHDKIVNVAFLAMLAACWVIAGLALYFL